MRFRKWRSLSQRTTPTMRPNGIACWNYWVVRLLVRPAWRPPIRPMRLPVPINHPSRMIRRQHQHLPLCWSINHRYLRLVSPIHSVHRMPIIYYTSNTNCCNKHWVGTGSINPPWKRYSKWRNWPRKMKTSCTNWPGRFYKIGKSRKMKFKNYGITICPLPWRYWAISQKRHPCQNGPNRPIR